MGTAVPRVSGFDEFEVVGRGGFSTVYSAVQVDLGRTVAVKVLNVDASEAAARRRFERECKVVGILSGVKGVVAVHQSAFTDDGRPCIVMELMRGGTLEAYVRDHGPLSEPDALQLAELLTTALATAHDRGVVHRDIKPGNVLLSGDGEVALGDFGIASVEHLAASSQTVESLSPPYAPPERFISGELDEQLSDIYSLGATLYFALTGSAPFGTARTGGVSGLIDRVMNDTPAPPARSDLPEGFVALVQQMLAKRPDQRPESCMAIRRSLIEISAAAAQTALSDLDAATGPPVAAEQPPPAAPNRRGKAPAQTVNIPPPPGAPTAPAIPLDRPADPYRSLLQEGEASDGTDAVWPTAVDYVQAIQDAGSLIAPELQTASLERDLLGMPVSAAGRSAVVFQHASDSGPVAFRFFTRPPHDGSSRYAALADHLVRNPCDCLVPARWLSEAIRVDGTVRPAVGMPWLPGRPLNLVVEDLLDDPVRLVALAEAFLEVLDEMDRAQVAHGDLQNGNILVDDELRIRLVDLDGIWIPALAGLPPEEAGHRCFQHAKRQRSDWGPGVDAFSGLLIYTTLLALSADPGLWSHHQGENLVLAPNDLEQPGATDAWTDMLGSRSAGVRALTNLLIEQAKADAPPTGSVSDVVRRLAPPDDQTMPRRSASAEGTHANHVDTASELAGHEPVGLGAADWWRAAGESSANGEGGQPAASQAQPAPWRRVVGAAVFGAVSGVIAGIVGSLAMWPIRNAEPGALQDAAPGLVVAIVAALLCGFIRARDDLACRRYARAATQWLGGLALGAAAAGLGLLAVDAYVDSLRFGETVRAENLAFCGLLLGGAVGLACAAGRSIDRALMGTVGGALGGVSGLLLLGVAGVELSADGRILLDTVGLGNFVTVAAATEVLGIAIAIALQLHDRRSGVE